MMQSAFGVDHGEINKALGMPKKPPMPGFKNKGQRSKPFGSTTRQKAQGLGQQAGAFTRNNLKPIAAAGGTGLAGYGIGRNKNKQPKMPKMQQPRSL